jgi:hypothetical protein
VAARIVAVKLDRLGNNLGRRYGPVDLASGGAVFFFFWKPGFGAIRLAFPRQAADYSSNC